jgi:hypothetical protein
MTIAVHDFRAYVVKPGLDVCESLGKVPCPVFTEHLLVATAAQETALGRWLHQAGGGPARSVYQIEPASLDDLDRGFISATPRFKPLMDTVRLGVPLGEQIMWDLRLATVIARLFYFRVREPLPQETTTESLWHYYKTYWNTKAGAATRDSFVNSLHAYTDIRA